MTRTPSRSARPGNRSLGKVTAVLLTAAMIVGTGLFASLGAATAEAGSGILVAMLIGGLIALLTGISALGILALLAGIRWLLIQVKIRPA